MTLNSNFYNFDLLNHRFYIIMKKNLIKYIVSILLLVVVALPPGPQVLYSQHAVVTLPPSGNSTTACGAYTATPDTHLSLGSDGVKMDGVTANGTVTDAAGADELIGLDVAALPTAVLMLVPDPSVIRDRRSLEAADVVLTEDPDAPAPMACATREKSGLTRPVKASSRPSTFCSITR